MAKALVLKVRCKNPTCERLFRSLLQFDPPSFAGAQFEARRYRCPRCRDTHFETVQRDVGKRRALHDPFEDPVDAVRVKRAAVRD